MTAAYGRTVKKHLGFYIDDSAGTLRNVAIDQCGPLGLSDDAVDMSTWSDAVKGVLNDQPDFSVEIGGVFDTTASTGGHTVMSGVSGLNTPLAFDFRIGILHAWEAGEQNFGVTGTTANGGIISNYKVDFGTMRWTATLSMYSGSAAPAWATTAHT